MQQLNTEDALGLFIQSIGDICVNNAPMKKCKSKSISSFFKHRKALMRKRRKLIIKSKKHGLTRREKIKEQLVDIESELLKSHNDERLHDENKALDRIKSDPNYFFNPLHPKHSAFDVFPEPRINKICHPTIPD